MGLRETTIEHRRDEAPAMHSRRAVMLSPVHREKKKSQLTATRPRLGLLARNHAREACEHSMPACALPSVAPRPIRWLLGDDQPVFGGLLADCFSGRAEFARPDFAFTGAHAVKQIRRGESTLLSLSLRLPDRNGLAPLLRIDLKYTAVPVIARSGRARRALNETGFPLGAPVFVQKSGAIAERKTTVHGATSVPTNIETAVAGPHRRGVRTTTPFTTAHATSARDVLACPVT